MSLVRTLQCGDEFTTRLPFQGAPVPNGIAVLATRLRTGRTITNVDADRGGHFTTFEMRSPSFPAHRRRAGSSLRTDAWVNVPFRRRSSSAVLWWEWNLWWKLSSPSGWFLVSMVPNPQRKQILQKERSPLLNGRCYRTWPRSAPSGALPIHGTGRRGPSSRRIPSSCLVPSPY